MLEFQIVKILVLSSLSFVVAIAWAPLLTNFLYKHKLGKRIRNNGATPIFSALHAHKAGTPTMGGLLVWVTVLAFSIIFYYLPKIIPYDFIIHFNFLTRSETLLPLGALVATALVGLIDDWLDITGKGVFGGGGLKVRHRLMIYAVIALFGAFWFYFKLGWDSFHIPFAGDMQIGWPYMLIFIFVIVATSFSVNETDGLDGLAGGTLLISFAAYGVIAFALGRFDLAAFCGVISGALLAFLWFNIPPARFIMGDTGAMSMGVTLGVIAMLTNSALFLPLIGFVFAAESVSVIIQQISKRTRGGKKVFLSSPIHHHFEALGWPESKIVMRFWVIASVATAFGLALFMLDKKI
jgi:phospho-N-acetylmuramoyl-pentapeptide-transferase